MKRIYFGLLAASVAILGACGGPGVPLSSLQPMQQNARAAGSDLLYVSDTDTSDAYVYKYPSGTLKQTLAVFRDPGGECVDAKGDVFVTNTGDNDVVEFAHGGKRPVVSLEDVGYFPIGCAVDPTTGNLAVTNFSSGTSGAGDVAIYEHAKGSAKHHYADSAIPGMLLCAYDASGNLFVDGFTSGSSGFAFAELPKGKSKLVNITLNQSIATAGGVAWDGKYVVVGDQAANAVYRFKISGSSGSKVGSTSLSGGSAIFQFSIFGNRLIGPNSAAGNVKIWKYPAGGNAVQTISGLYAPLGTAVSKAP